MTRERLPDRRSGYDPETGICWQFRNKGDRSKPRCKCPAHSGRYGERTIAWFGRCRSGSRWFWSAATFNGEKEANGWADTEEEAMNAAMAAVCAFREELGLPILADLSQGWASGKLKKLNEAKRRARPAPDTSDARTVEYLYAHEHCDEGCCGCKKLTGTARWNYHLKKFQIIKKTKQRIYYSRNPLLFEDRPDNYPNIRNINNYGTGFVDRAKIEREGKLYTSHTWHQDWQLYLSPPEPAPEPEPPDLHQLKAEMAAAHPDHGGSSAAFIAARAVYVAARRRLRPRPAGGSTCGS